MIRIALLAAVAAAVAGCSGSAGPWQPQTVPVIVEPPGASQRPLRARCRPLDPAIAAEAQKMTHIATMRDGGIDALSSALMASEARKNAWLKKAAENYRRCSVLIRKSLQ